MEALGGVRVLWGRREVEEERGRGEGVGGEGGGRRE